jgi:hypothetical protein
LQTSRELPERVVLFETVLQPLPWVAREGRRHEGAVDVVEALEEFRVVVRDEGP